MSKSCEASKQFNQLLKARQCAILVFKAHTNDCVKVFKCGKCVDTVDISKFECCDIVSQSCKWKEFKTTILNCKIKKHCTSCDNPCDNCNCDNCNCNDCNDCDNCNNSCKNSCSCDNCECPGTKPNIEQLAEWTEDDWVAGKDFPIGTDFTAKRYFYDSSLALDGDLFTVDEPNTAPKPYPPKYYVRNLKTNYKGPSPGVPGPFEYTFGYDQWGGDIEYQVGQYYYPGIIDDFGHTHIITIHAKIAARIRDPCTNTPDQDKMLEHLASGSAQIFAWYANVVDIDGNRIPIDNTPAGQLRGLMDKLIFGTGTVGGVIDPQEILDALTVFAGTNAILLAEIDKLEAFLNDVLRLDTQGADPIELLAWSAWMNDHQTGMYETYEKYRKVYNTPKCDPGYQDAVDALNMHSRHMVDGGRQVAGFFGLFYSATAFLDKLLTIGGDNTDEAIPSQFVDERVTFIHLMLKRYWYEHVIHFDDYNKAAALCDFNEMYRIQLNMLQSCTSVAGHIGEIFRAFDKLVRFRGLYSKI